MLNEWKEKKTENESKEQTKEKIERKEKKNTETFNPIFHLPMEAFRECRQFDDDSSARRPLAQPMTPP